MKAALKYIYCIFIIIIFTCNSDAQEFESSVVVGNTYNCYIVVFPLDVINTHITFGAKGSLQFSEYPGDGYYMLLTSFFMGSYLSLDQQIGPFESDFVFLMTGLSFDPFITGIGLAVRDYTYVYGMMFFGVRMEVGEEE